MCDGALMKYALVSISLVATAGCASSQVASQDALMDEIERSVILPAGALPLQSYARYYTEDRDLILGAYTTQVEEPRPADYGCEEAQIDGSSKPVECSAIADVPRGQRRWVKFRDFPYVGVEDCGAIQLAFDPRTRKIIHLECVQLSY